MKTFKGRLKTEDDAPRREKRTYSGSTNWIVVAAVVIFVAAIMGIIVCMVMLFSKFLGFGVETASQALQYTRTYTLASQYTGTFNYDYLYGDETTDAPSDKGGSGNKVGAITAGVITGNTYKSSFSGVTFTAPDGWTVTGGSNSTSQPDLSAHNANSSMSAKAQYFAMDGAYSTPAEIINALKAQIDSSAIAKDNVSVSIGGNNCTGFIFKGQNGKDTAYSEILACDVNGYCLVFQIIAPDASGLTTVLGMFS